ncbi:MAG: TolC family protein, partial [Phascolarctobacterium sp.]|nr:TolC family protein [Phascolarctobacterium sp.]
MSRNKLSKRLLMLSAAITMLLCQSAFAAEKQVNAEVQAAAEAPVVQLNMDEAMARAFETNPAIKIAGYSKDAARGTLNAARASRWITIKGSASAVRGGMDEEWYNLTDGKGKGQARIGNQYSNSVTATMPLYTGGALSGQI